MKNTHFIKSIVRKYLPMLMLVIGSLLRVHFYYKVDITRRNINVGTPIIVQTITSSVVETVQYSLPKIPADLLLGMTIGVDSIKQDKTFYQNLITTGLVHVVVVSGYNVALVISFISNIFYQKLRNSNKVYIFIFLALYVILCGMQPPVIRAALMGYIVYLASTEGRSLDGMYLLLFVCLLMVFIMPSNIESLSFWLSSLATLGLMLYQRLIQSSLELFFTPLGKIMKIVPLEDLSSSLACQITVWPLIAYFFGRVSWVSPLYNLFVLWLIPMCTILGFLYLVIAYVLPFLTGIYTLFMLPFFDIFIRAINFFAYIDRGSGESQISLKFFISYYFIVFVFTLLFKARLKKQGVAVTQ